MLYSAFLRSSISCCCISPTFLTFAYTGCDLPEVLVWEAFYTSDAMLVQELFFMSSLNNLNVSVGCGLISSTGSACDVMW